MKRLFLFSVILPLCTLFCFGQKDAETTDMVHKSNVSTNQTSGFEDVFTVPHTNDIIDQNIYKKFHQEKQSEFNEEIININESNSEFVQTVSQSGNLINVEYNIPLFEAFDDVEPGDIPEGWSRITNADNWRVSSNHPIGKYTGSKSVITSYHTVIPKNDWLFSPVLHLIGGISYDVEFHIRAPGWAGKGEKLAVKWGDAPNPAGMNRGTIYKNTNLLFNTNVNQSFTPEASGEFYIGWHAFSDHDLNYISIDNITIRETPEIDIALTQFIQVFELPEDRDGNVLRDYSDIISKTSKTYVEQTETLDYEAKGMPSSNGTYSHFDLISKHINRNIPAADLIISAIVENVGQAPSDYALNWEVDGVLQTPHPGALIQPGLKDTVFLISSQLPRGTFFADGLVEASGDENASNNAMQTRVRIFPEEFERTIYDRGDNNVNLWVGFDNPNMRMISAVRFTATDTITPIGVDFMCRTQGITGGNYTVELRSAGETDQAPGAIIFSTDYTNPAFFASAGYFLHFAFTGPQLVTFTPDTDYWIVVYSPLGVPHPAAVHTHGIHHGHSFYYSEITDQWVPLVLGNAESAFMMRSVHVSGEVSVCNPPTEFNTSTVNETSVELSWTAGSTETQWHILYGPEDFDIETEGTLIENVAENPYTLTGLEPATSYDVYIRAVCDEDLYSEWSGPVQFTTLGCPPYSIPLFENFDEVTPPELPECWSSLSAGNGAVYTSPLGGYSNQNFLYIIAGSGAQYSLVSSPQLNQPLNESRIVFFASTDLFFYPGLDIILPIDECSHLEIGTMNDPDNINTFEPIQNIEICNHNWKQFYVYLNNYEGDNQHIAFRVQSDFFGGNARVRIDDILIEPIPSCVEPWPSSLAAENITINSALLSWIMPINGDYWDIEWGETGFTQGEGTLIQATPDNPFLLEDLQHSTMYDFYVRTNCGDGDYSTWEGPHTFITAIVPPYFQDFDDTLDLPPGWDGIFWVSPQGGVNNTQALTYLFWALDWDWYGAAEAITPIIELTEDNEYKLLFSYRIVEGNEPHNPNESMNFNVQVSTDYGLNYITLFTIDQSNHNLSSDYTEIELTIPSTYIGNVIFRFFHSDINVHYSGYNVYIDNFKIIPTCAAPTDIFISDPTNISVIVNWTAGNDETEWEILYGEMGFNPETEGVLVTGIIETSYLLEYLTTDEQYDIYVRALCDEALTSSWAGPVSFTATSLSIFNLSGSGIYCQGTSPTGMTALLDGSVTGVSYQLHKNEEPFGTPLQGNGQPLQWDDLTEGIYTVFATGAENAAWMNGTVIIEEHKPVSISSVFSTPASICVGSSIELMVETEEGCGNISYHWTSDPPGFSSSLQNPAATPVVNTTYFVEVTDDAHTQTASVLLQVFEQEPPESVENMLPADNSIIPQTQVTLAWQPGFNSYNYDVYIWEDSEPAPEQPVIADLTTIQHTQTDLISGVTYNWRIVSKNPCYYTVGPVQSFTIGALPDLVVSDVQVPLNPSTGQQIEISWTTFNQGSLGTENNSWFDAVYLCQSPVYNPEFDIYLGAQANPTALAPNTGYSNNLHVTLPKSTFGNLYIIVKADAYNSINESNSDNNATVVPINISLTPPPDLQVTNLIIPSTAFSGESITVQWTTTNTGEGAIINKTWIDRVYFSEHSDYIPQSATSLGQESFSINLLPGESYNGTTNVTLPEKIFGVYYIHVYTDATNTVYEHANEHNNVLGSDLEIILSPPPDLIVTEVQHPLLANNNEIISIDWTVLNQGAAPTDAYWRDKIWICPHEVFDESESISLGTKSQNIVLEPGEFYQSSLEATIPSDITGEYYVFVHTDYQNNVFEHINDENNIGGSDMALLVQNADLMVDNALLASSAWSGETITVTYDVTNIGEGKVVNTPITDKVFLSQQNNFPVVDPVLLGSLTYTETILSEQSIHKSINISIPDGISGNYFVFICTNADNTVFENNLLDNNCTWQPINIELSPYPDLMIDSFLFPSEVELGFEHTITVNIKNTGNASISNKSWKDALFVSDSAEPDRENAILLWQQTINETLETDELYTINAEVMFPINKLMDINPLFLHYFADVDNQVFELNINNNLVSSQPIPVEIPPGVDFQLHAASSDVQATLSGSIVNFTYTVRNPSTQANIWGITAWKDAVYLSSDMNFSPDDMLITEWPVMHAFLPDSTYTVNYSFNVPHYLSGNYYFIVVTDHDQTTNDTDYSNNALSLTGADPVFIDETLYPDLEVELFESPLTGIAGQTIQFNWQVSNIGDGPVPNNSWTDKVYLSQDYSIGSNDITLATKAIQAPLPANQSYSESIEVVLPSDASGNYIIIFKTDANNNVWEKDDHIDNNYAFASIHITRPPAGDLVVESISFPDHAESGKMITISYTLKNIGQFPTTGSIRDAIYFTADDDWDSGDPVFGYVRNSINLAPQDTHSAFHQSRLPGLLPGNYSISARTNILNNIPETDYQNNITTSDAKMSVQMPQLVLGEEKPDELVNAISRYYSLNIAPEFDRETLLLTIEGDPLNGINELYLGYESIPTRSSHNYSATQPFMASQELIVPELQTGNYYLMVYGSTTAGSFQNINLLASILPFGIRSVHSDKGGNSGNVTVMINGAKFDEYMTLKLDNGQGKEYPAASMRFIDPSRVYATFNLRNATLGIYDVVAEKPDNDSAVLEDGFEIVRGEPAILSVNVLAPPNVRPNRNTRFTINFSNSGNTDLVDPYINVKSEAGAPVGLSLEQLDYQLKLLNILLNEKDGPPGILRPGYNGQLFIYTRSTSGLGFMIEY